MKWVRTFISIFARCVRVTLQTLPVALPRGGSFSGQVPPWRSSLPPLLSGDFHRGRRPCRRHSQSHDVGMTREVCPVFVILFSLP